MNHEGHIAYNIIREYCVKVRHVKTALVVQTVTYIRIFFIMKWHLDERLHCLFDSVPLTEPREQQGVEHLLSDYNDVAGPAPQPILSSSCVKSTMLYKLHWLSPTLTCRLTNSSFYVYLWSCFQHPENHALSILNGHNAMVSGSYKHSLGECKLP